MMDFLTLCVGAALWYTLSSHSIKASVPHFQGFLISSTTADICHKYAVAITGRRGMAAPMKELIGKVLVRAIRDYR